MMMRLFWRECREQAWFAVAAFLSPALVALATNLMPGGPGLGSGQGANALTYVLFAVWGAWVVARERDRGRSEMSIVPVPEWQLWQARALPGLVTAILSGGLAYLLMYQQAASAPVRPGEIADQATGLPSMSMLSATMVIVFMGAYLITLALRRSGASLRTLALKRWFIGATVIITGTVVGTTILLYERVYDAQASFAPTDQAVRRVLNSGNDEKSAPMLTEDSRLVETKRIAGEVNAPDNAARALYYLANVGEVRRAATSVLNGKPIDDPAAVPD